MMNRSQNTSPEHDEVKLAGDVIDVAERSPLFRWLDNFWYHYKWTVIVVSFFAIVLVVGVIQMFSDPVYDINITYSGPYCFTVDEAEEMYDALSDALPEDLNGDGKTHAGLIRYQIYSEEEINADLKRVEEERREAEANGEDPSKIVSAVNLAYNSEQYSQFTKSLLTGQCYIYICSPFIYLDMKADGRVVPFANMTDTPPENAFDDCAVLLKDTEMYRNAEILQKLPEDTVICLLSEIPQLFSQSEATQHADAVTTFLGIIR